MKKILKKFFEDIRQKSIKQQLNLIYIPIILISIITIGIFSYYIQIKQVKKNASYLIRRSINQTGISVNEKINIPFSQMVAESSSTPLENLFADRYDSDEDSKRYTDILDCYNQMETIYYNSSDMIDSIYFITNSGVELSVYKESTPVYIKVDFKKWFNKSIYSDSGYGWVGSHPDKVFSTRPARNVISIVRKFGTSHSKNKAILIYNLKTEYFTELLDKVNIGSNGFMMILSPDGKPIVNSTCKNDNVKNYDINEIKGIVKDGTNRDVIMGNEKTSVYNSSIEDLCTVVGIVPQKDLLNELDNFKIILLVFVAVLCLILLYTSNLLAKVVTKPIELLSKRVKEFELGNVDVKFEIDTENEIGTLSKGLQSLKQSVIQLLAKVLEEEKKKSQLELSIMQSQIKPHFLYNTLGSIKHLIDMDKNDKASEMCAALSKFYMIGISGGRDIIQVREEVEHVRNYLKIQQMRYEKDFEFYINISDEILDEKILILTLQPIIENSIYHGIKDKEGLGTIILSGEKKHNKMTFEIYDDGLGMTEEELEALSKAMEENKNDSKPNSFGIRNVYSRLKLYFGNDAQIKFFSIKNEFTQVIIEIPIETNPKGEDIDV